MTREEFSILDFRFLIDTLGEQPGLRPGRPGHFVPAAPAGFATAEGRTCYVPLARNGPYGPYGTYCERSMLGDQ